jgi:hypothetical protein
MGALASDALALWHRHSLPVAFAATFAANPHSSALIRSMLLASLKIAPCLRASMVKIPPF